MASLFVRVLCLCMLVALSAAFFSSNAITRTVSASRGNLVMRERKCDLAGTRKNTKCNNVSKSNAHTHKIQEVNLQTRKLWWEEGNKFVRIRVSARTLKTIKKNGLNAVAKKYNIDLNRFSISSGVAPVPEAVIEA